MKNKKILIIASIMLSLVFGIVIGWQLRQNKLEKDIAVQKKILDQKFDKLKKDLNINHE